MHRLILFILCSTCIFLAGCANHTQDYLKHGKQINSMVVPAGVPPLKQATYYPIPKVSTQPITKPVVLTPPTLQKK